MNTVRRIAWHPQSCSCWWVVALFIHIVDLGSAGAYADDSFTELHPAAGSVVMITGTVSDLTQIGAGIIVGLRDDRLVIATANHLVRPRRGHEISNIKVRLKGYPDAALDADLLAAQRPDLDLALIEVKDLAAKGIDEKALDLHVLARPDSLPPASRVYPVGNPNNVAWGRPATPAPGFEREGNRLHFESEGTIPGHSGGGLIEESGVLVGMVLDVYPPKSRALDIQVLAEAVKSFGYPFTLKLAHAYGVEGVWAGSTMFPKIRIEVEGDRVVGTLTAKHPRPSELRQQVQRTAGEQVQVSYVSSEVDTEVRGLIRGNALLLDAKGVWSAATTLIPNPGQFKPKVLESRIEFAVHLRGLAQQDAILFRYEFKYPLSLEYATGEFVAKRGLKRPLWQLILEEVMNSN